MVMIFPARLLLGICCLLALSGWAQATGLPVKKLTLAGPAAGVSNALIHLVASGQHMGNFVSGAASKQRLGMGN